MPHKKPKKGECLPEHKPTAETRAMVEAMVVNGVTIKQMAGVLDINKDTLQKHYKYELTNAKTALDLNVTRRFKAFMFDDELDPRISLDAMKHYSNAKMGWKQQQANENTQKVNIDGGTLDKLMVTSVDDLIALGKGLKGVSNGDNEQASL